MDYLIVYLGVGLFMAICALFHRKSNQKKHLGGLMITVFFWPLIILFSPQFFCPPRQDDETDISPPDDTLRAKLQEILSSDVTVLLEEEKNRLKEVAKYGERDIWKFHHSDNFKDILYKFWDLEISPEIYQAYKSAKYHLSDDYDPNRLSPRFCIADSVDTIKWFVGFSRAFIKSISKMDLKKRGRILEAIEKIAHAPMELHGDTIKPLNNNHGGLWRCRVGDDRIIYFPDSKKKTVVLIPDFPLADLVDYADKVGGLAALAHSPANHARFRLGTDSRRRSLPGLPCHLAPIANTKPCSVDNVC